MDVAKLRTSTPQTIPTGNITTVVNLNSIEIAATGPAITPSTGSLDIRINESGVYLIIWENLIGGTGSQLVAPTINGTVVTTPAQYNLDQGANDVSLGKTMFLSLSAGSVVGLVAAQNSGSSVSLTATLTVVKIS